MNQNDSFRSCRLLMSTWRDSICAKKIETCSFHSWKFQHVDSYTAWSNSIKFVVKRDPPNHGQTCGHRFGDVIWRIPNPTWRGGHFNFLLTPMGGWVGDKLVVPGGFVTLSRSIWYCCYRIFFCGGNFFWRGFPPLPSLLLCDRGLKLRTMVYGRERTQERESE